MLSNANKMVKFKDRSIKIVFLFIPICLLITFTFMPIVVLFRNSFYSMSLTKEFGFVGWENYKLLFSSQEYLLSLKVNLYYVLAAIIQVGLSLIIALILDKIKRVSLIKGLLFFPYLINGIAVGYIFLLFFSHGMVFDTVLSFLGVDIDSIPYWLRDQSINNFVLAFVSVWRYSGLSLVIFLGALSTINPQQYYLTKLEDSNAIQTFRYVIWPKVSNVVSLNLLLSVVSSLSEFEIPYSVMGGANGTSTFMVLIYKVAFQEHRIGLASAMVVILLVQIIFWAFSFLMIKKLIKLRLAK